VPFIIRWPGRVKAGRVDTENVCSFIDWMPTLCVMAGINKLPEQLDGEDVSDIWFGADREREKPLFWRPSAPGGGAAIRMGQWKLHLSAHRKQEQIELYNLSSDPSESQNVADKHPDVVARLTKTLHAWIAELPEDYEKFKGRK
jgi:N-acetylgalactosamine-6-sulfatase